MLSMPPFIVDIEIPLKNAYIENISKSFPFTIYPPLSENNLTEIRAWIDNHIQILPWDLPTHA